MLNPSFPKYLSVFFSSFVNREGKGQSPEKRGELEEEGGKQPAIFFRDRLYPETSEL